MAEPGGQARPSAARRSPSRARQRRRSAPDLLPVLPLRTAVVLPGERAVLPVGRPRSVAAVRAAQAGDGRLLLCPQRDPECEEPAPADLAEVAALARVGEVEPDGAGLRVGVEGLARVRWSAPAEPVCDFLEAALAEAGEPQAAAPEDLAAAAGWLWERVRALSEAAAPAGTPEGAGLPPLDRPADFADALGARLLRGREERLALLACFPPAERLQLLHRLLLPRLPRPSADRDLARRTLRQMQEEQRRHLLMEQLKAIRRELGEGEEAEAEHWRALLRAAGLPPAALEAGLREAARLERMPAVSPEASIARTYLEWLTALPWARSAAERGDLAAARAVLDRAHHGLARVKERLLEHLAVHILRQSRAQGGGAAAALCLVGPPGVGKTSLARSVAEALDRPFVRAALGGVRDEAEIRGHRRTYVGALPGRIVAGLRRAGVRNPVMLLDEIDKLGSDGRGDPAAALLEVLDPEQQPVFSDNYLEVPFDLSGVMFIATANDVGGLPAPLRDRLEVVALPPYSDEEKAAIATAHLLPRQVAAHALPAGALSVTPAAVRALVRAQRGEPGVRGLERAIAALCRKAARQVVEDPSARLRVTAHNAAGLVGSAEASR
jgi:ATP-dependent Lon protease